MTFLVSPQTAWTVGAICALGGAVWTWLEFRRHNRRQWLLRVVAAVLAALTLAALGMRPAETYALPNVPPA